MIAMIHQYEKQLVVKRIIDCLFLREDAHLGLTHNELRKALYGTVGSINGTVDGLVKLITSKNAETQDKAHLMSIGNGLNFIIEKLKQMDIGASLKNLSRSGGSIREMVRNMIKYSDFLREMSNPNEYATKLDRGLLRKLAADVRNQCTMIQLLEV